jgi:transcriptional regulator of arginine metabolism
MASTERRREALLSLIGSRVVATQEELVSALRSMGVTASQASVSRDVAALGLVKAGGRYVLPPPTRAPENPLEERVSEFLLSVTPAGENLVVLKTPPGEASGVALALDRLALAGVVGTVAGDDTIFAAVEGRRSGAAVLRTLRALLRRGGGEGA